jgi:hypothetical protein
LKHAGVDRTGNKIWHYGPTSRVYIQSKANWKVLCSTYEELQEYVAGLHPIGPEWHLMAYFKDKVIPVVEAELERKRQEELAEIQRLQRLAREEQLKIEKQQLLMLGPRRSRRAKSKKNYTLDDDDTDDTEFEEQSSSSGDEEEKPVVVPERRSERHSKVLVETEDENDDPLTA